MRKSPKSNWPTWAEIIGFAEAKVATAKERVARLEAVVRVLRASAATGSEPMDVFGHPAAAKGAKTGRKRAIALGKKLCND